MSVVFKKTEKLSKAVQLINELELKTLYRLLQILSSSLLIQASSTDQNVQQMEFLASFDENVTSGAKFILEKALYSTLNPDKLYNGLIEMNVWLLFFFFFT